MKPRAVIIFILCVLHGTALLTASEEESSILYTLSGAQMYDEFGYSLAPLGDVDGDGAPDFAVGAIQTFFNSDARGKVQVFSGKDGKLLWTWRGERQAQEFGESICAISDLDHDGKKEVGVSDTADMVRIYSTGSGELIKSINIRKGPISIVPKILEVNDINHDGQPDLLAGQPGHSDSGKSEGRIAVYSISDGALIWEVMGRFNDGLLGDSIAGIEDVDGDGVNDVAAGESHGWYAAFPHEPGTVYILSGTDGREIRQLGNDPELFFFGHRMANVGDLDEDGRPELAITAPGYGVGLYRDIGWIGIYSTRTSELIRSFQGVDGQFGLFLGDQLGVAVSSAGDADGDGVPDLLLGTSRFGTTSLRSQWGRIELRSGKTGALLSAYEGLQDRENFVSALASLGDIDGDGRSEFLIGSLDAPAPRGTGQVIAVKFRPELPLFLRGDGNQDGRVNIADVVSQIRVLYFDGPKGPCFRALDVDGDGTFDILDLLSLLEFLFQGGYSPAPPFPECGRYGGFDGRELECRSSVCS